MRQKSWFLCCFHKKPPGSSKECRNESSNSGKPIYLFHAAPSKTWYRLNSFHHFGKFQFLVTKFQRIVKNCQAFILNKKCWLQVEILNLHLKTFLCCSRQTYVHLRKLFDFVANIWNEFTFAVNSDRWIRKHFYDRLGITVAVSDEVCLNVETILKNAKVIVELICGSRNLHKSSTIWCAPKSAK